MTTDYDPTASARRIAELEDSLSGQTSNLGIVERAGLEGK
jgi:hypothetical protein